MYNPETKILKVIDFGSAVTFETNQMTHYRKVGTVTSILIFSHIT